MTISQLPVDIINGGWFTLYDCMKLARVDTAHMQKVKESRFYPIIHDKTLLAVWGKFIEKKNEHKSAQEELELKSKLGMESLEKIFSLRSLVIYCMPSSMSNRLGRVFPSVKETLGRIDEIKENGLAAMQLAVHAENCKNALPALKNDFLAARDDLLVMALVGGREKYEALPELFDNIGDFEEPYKAFAKTCLQPVREIFNRDRPSVSPIFNNDKAFFLSVVYMKVVDLRADYTRPAQPLNEMKPHLDPFFSEFPNLIPMLEAKCIALKGESGAKVWNNSEFLSLCVHIAPAPIMRIPKNEDARWVSEGFVIRLKVHAKEELLCVTKREAGAWYMETGDNLFTQIGDTGDAILDKINKEKVEKARMKIVSDKGKLTENYEMLYELLEKKRFVDFDGTIVVIE